MVWWTAQNLVIASLLAAGVWVLCRVKRIGPTARHAMWVVVLVKLLTPPLVFASSTATFTTADCGMSDISSI